MDPRNEEPFDREPWRRLLGAESGAPAQGVDRRILAEARRVHMPRVALWYLPASLAASLLLAVLIVQWQLADSGAPSLVTESDVLPAQAPVAAEEETPAAALEALPQRQDMPATSSGNVPPPAVEVPNLESRRQSDAEPAAVQAPAAPAALAPPPQEPARAREQPAIMKSAADAEAAVSEQAVSVRELGNFRAPSEPAAALRTPEEWYAEIEALRAAGRIKEADTELARLETAYPGWLERHRQQNP